MLEDNAVSCGITTNTFKWFLPLSIHYTHFGNLKDFPIRIIVTPSSHFQAGGVDVDVVLNQSDMITNDNQDTQSKDHTGRMNNFFLTKGYLVLKFNSLVRTQHDFHLLSRKASITVNIACRMDNSYGRGCWRDGGMCHVSLLELLNNANLSTTKKILFSSRKVYNSGYNVAEDDKLTGVVSLAVYGDYTGLTEKTVTSFIGGDKSNNKWQLITIIGYASTDSTNNDNSPSILSGLFCKNKSNQKNQGNPIILSVSDLIRLLFGLIIVHKSQEITYEYSKTMEGYLRRNKLDLAPSNSSTNDHHRTMISKVESDWARYKRMLDNLFDDLVEIDVSYTKRMKCPWTPMDTAVFESYSDYSNDYVILTEEQERVMERGSNNSEDNKNLEKLYELLFGYSPYLNDSTSFESIKGKESNLHYSHVFLSQHEKASLNPEYVNQNIWLFDETTVISTTNSLSSEKKFIGGKKERLLEQQLQQQQKQRCKGELQETVKILSFIENLSKNDREKSKKRIYLPFFAYIIHQPLLVYKNYWGITLNILISRNSHLYSSYEDFEKKFFNSELTTPAEKARLSFELVCTYSQSLEYISDYYMTKRKANNQKQQQQQQKEEEEEEDPQKIEIEQFWNSLRAMCGDCDDLSFAILQFYYNFVKNKAGASFQFIQTNRVLREMRRMLEDNYIIMYNIEGVYLAKQTAGGETGVESMYDKLRPKDAKIMSSTPYTKLPQHLRDIVDDYYSDIADMNSAHAAIKLIPKLYFERCVNRSYEVLNKKTNKRKLKAPFKHCSKGEPSPSSCSSTRNYTCKYHLNLPDTYNDDLPILMGEGTSMLNCGSNVPDTCKEPMFKDYVLSDALINDIAKVPIYAKKGESDFYKASLFSACLDFMDTENIATFTYCRENDHFYNERRRERTNIGKKLPFLRGVSHKQLSFKSERVVLLPYGHSLNSNDNYTLEETVQHSCQHISFANPEMSSFMKSICLSECQKRLRPMKVKRHSQQQQVVDEVYHSKTDPSSLLLSTIGNPERVSHQDQLLKMLNSKSLSNPKVYNMLFCDTKWNVQTSFNLLKNWCTKMNETHNNKMVTEHYGKYLEDTSISFTSGDGGFFCMFLDNYYITPLFLEHLERNVAPKCPLRFETSFLLEVHSADMILWKLRFDIKTIVV